MSNPKKGGIKKEVKSMEKDELLKRMDEMVKEAREWRLNNPPQIIPEGWWWKKFVPKYRRLKKLMDAQFAHEWKNGGMDAIDAMEKRLYPPSL